MPQTTVQLVPCQSGTRDPNRDQSRDGQISTKTMSENKMNRGGFEPPHLSICECSGACNRLKNIRFLESHALDRSAICPWMVMKY
jgi:hypothetical protein